MDLRLCRSVPIAGLGVTTRDPFLKRRDFFHLRGLAVVL